MYKGSYLTINILTVKGKYNPHAYFRANMSKKISHVIYELPNILER